MSVSSIFYGLVTIAFLALFFFSFTVQARGDEGGVYLDAFVQAYKKWPVLDTKPFWTISSVYLWLIAALQAIAAIFSGLHLLLIGRILSLFCWLMLVVRHIRSGTCKGLVVLFNPYVLVYATRAHPFLPGILLFYIFWELTRLNKKRGLLFLLLAVNFQVFIAGATGLFMPTFPLKKVDVIRIVNIGMVCIAGVLITWLTWGGIYPANFVNHIFYKNTHLHGKPSFGYLLTVLMLAGTVLWVAGNRTIPEIRAHKLYSAVVMAGSSLSAIILFFSADIIGVAREASYELMGNYYQVGWVSLYALIGLGWLRVHRDQYMLFFGIVTSGVVLVTLPYLYERISIFAIIAPCLAWCSLVKNENQQAGLLLAVCCIFLLFASIYEVYGTL